MRDPTGCRSENDETMRAGWLAGKRNPVSGDPLDIATLDLPPGSVVSRHDTLRSRVVSFIRECPC